MNVFVIIALAGIVALAFFWDKKTGLNGPPPRTLPASRGKKSAKPKL